MAKAPSAQRWILGGLAVAGLLALAAFVPISLPLDDAAPVDPVTTGGITPAPVPARALAAPRIETAAAVATVPLEVPPSKGSDAFQAALALLATGEESEAYAASTTLADDLERRTIQWAAIYYGRGAIDYSAIEQFRADAPLFLTDAVYRARLEAALVKEEVPGHEVIRLLAEQTPGSAGARIALAEAYLSAGDKERATALARSLWVEEFLDDASERKVLDGLGSLLTGDEHWARAVHLLMHDRATATERLLDRLTDGQRQMALARIAVSRKAKNAKALLDALPEEWQGHPLYLFSRVQRAHQADLLESAVDWMDKAEGELPDAAEWWYERRTIVRKLLAEGKPDLAYRAAAGYTSGPEGRLVEAHFHAGWIALAFLDDAASARRHFETMGQHSTLPESVAQANYWLGRSLIDLGEEDSAREAFATAAAFPTIFYGQLSRAALGMASVDLRTMPDAAGSETAFGALEVIRAVELLAANGKEAMAATLLRGYVPRLDTGPKLLLAARLAQSLGAHSLAITIADDAERRGMPLDLFSFPKDGLPADVELAAVDKAAVYAITKQESHFQIDAVSSAGARGLMQLMPGTARETAGKIGLEYSQSRLTSDPHYNALLGSTYLAGQLQRYEGSLVLAAAAYNAGAGNANRWIRDYGDPRLESVDPVVWVELIPFQETRKYVQRVLGNYLVYRARLGNGDISIVEALRRIPS